jgi:hypothetical protein
MGLITDKPEDLKPQNDLDDIHDPELDDYGLSIDRYLAFGTSPNAVPNPPKEGEIVEYRVKVTCKGEAWGTRGDGEKRYRSELTILSVARAGQELPPDYEKPKKRTKADEDAELAAAAAEDQPPLFPDEADDEDQGVDDE